MAGATSITRNTHTQGLPPVWGLAALVNGPDLGVR